MDSKVELWNRMDSGTDNKMGQTVRCTCISSGTGGHPMGFLQSTTGPRIGMDMYIAGLVDIPQDCKILWDSWNGLTLGCTCICV